MKLLSLISIGVLLASGPLWAETIYLDATGADGKDATHGTSYNTSPGSSFGTGRDGGDASNSTEGTDGGDINVNLNQITTTTNKAVMVISGTVRGAGRNASLTLDGSSLVTADAHGGGGGHGGVGGNGEGGCNGSRGRDATQYSSGTSGGNGCNAGDGGKGTPGSAGGNGGNVKAKVKIDETHLFLAFTCDTSPGAGGNAGRNGQGGTGGHGGPGGSSYSWSESVYDGESCTTTSFRNSNGSYSTSRSCSPKYRTVHHSNSGGMNGSSGFNGSDGHGNIQAGQSGRAGSCVYLVENAQGSVTSYKNKFTLSVASFKIRDANKDGIIEPGEKLFVENMVVKNGDGVPSPAGKSKLSLFLRSSRYIMAEPISIELPQIEGHSTYNVPGSLPLTILDTNPMGIEDRWADKDGVQIDNNVTVVDRAIPNFTSARTIEITYPIELTRFDFPISAAANEDRPVVWVVKNISGRDFGGESELARMIQIHMETNGGLAANMPFAFKDDQGQSIQIAQSYIREILTLKAGQELRMTGSLHVPAEVLPYTELNVRTNLGLGMDPNAGPRKIQVKNRTLRIAQTFNPQSEADVVLVTHSKTQRNEFVAWQEVFKKLNLKIAVWDISYYGYLSLAKDFEGTSTNFKRYLKDKTMVILNESESGNGAVAQKLARDEFLEAAAQSNARFLVVGGSKNDLNKLLTQLVIPTNRTGHMILESGTHPTERELPEKIGDALTMNFVKTYYFWDMPSKKDLDQQVIQWNAYLQNMNPKDKYTFSSYFQPSQKEENWYSTTYDIGLVQIGRTLTPGGGLALTLPLDGNDVHDPNQIDSEEIQRAVLLALDPVFLMAKSNLFDLKNSKLGFMVQDALIYQAISEIDREEVFFDVGGTPPDEKRWIFFKKLDEFVNQHRSDQTVLLASNIAAATDFYASKIPYLGNWSLGRSIQSYLDGFAKVAYNVNPSLYRENKSKFMAKLERNFDHRNKLLVNLNDRENARHQLLWPAIYRLNSTEIMLERNLVTEEPK